MTIASDNLTRRGRLLRAGVLLGTAVAAAAVIRIASQMFAEPPWLGHFGGHLSNGVAAGLLFFAFRAWEAEPAQRMRTVARYVTQIALVALAIDLAVEAQAAWIEFPTAGPLHTATTALSLPLLALAVIGLIATALTQQRWARRVPLWVWGLSGAVLILAVLALIVLLVGGFG